MGNPKWTGKTPPSSAPKLPHGATPPGYKEQQENNKRIEDNRAAMIDSHKNRPKGNEN